MVLIGTSLVSESAGGRVVARIVETEAYVPGDAASHAFRGETTRNASLFRRRGLAYVYFIYGCYFCINVSSEREGVGAGVLVRAAEPVEGIDLMQARRPRSKLRDLCRSRPRSPSRACTTVSTFVRPVPCGSRRRRDRPRSSVRASASGSRRKPTASSASSKPTARSSAAPVRSI
jgi:DNA-3-methyladenine glycosylase